jgi:UDP-N-acetylmuramyl pentapeptide phosphotransferase/UDP-N-acetylglucosamine-1-phosphate transferase
MPLSQFFISCVGVFSISLLTALLTTPLSIRWGIRAGLLDYPNERRIHPRTVARSGGLALVLGFYSGAACIYLLLPHYQGGLGPAWLRAFFLASLVILLTGLYDDRKGLRAEIKLLGQLLAASLMYFLTGQSFGSILGYALPGSLDFFLTLFWFLAITNAFNLIDGLDGLCAGITVISALGLGVSFIIRQMPADSLVCFALAGAALGFLYYNFHPAKVFLGDTGSMFCGFCLAAMALQTNGKSTLLVTVGIPILAAGIPVMDTMLAIWRRSARSMLARRGGDKKVKGLLHADLEHIHHRLLALGLNQRQVALILYLATLFCVILGLLSVLGSKTGFGLFLIIFTAGVYVLIRHVVHVELWDTGKLLMQHIGNRSSRRGFFSLFFYPLWDLTWLTLSFGLSFWLVTSLTITPFIFNQWLGRLFIWLPWPYVALIIGKTYYKVWFHATNKDYLELVSALVSGTLLSIGFASLMQQDISFFAVVLGLLFCLFSLLGIIGIRGIAPVFREWMLTTKRFQHPKGDNPLQYVLLYGAGRRCGLFMREQHLSSYRETEFIRVAGIIDDSPFLRKRLIHGLRVIGGFDELESAVDALHIERVIVTIDLNKEKLARLKKLAERKNFDLCVWRSKLYPL